MSNAKFIIGSTGGQINFSKVTSPDTPPTGYVGLYAQNVGGSDTILGIDSNGNVITFGGGGTGANGSSGTSGISGSSGTSGVAGSSGTSGAAGAQGAAGSSGTSGANGSSGTSGAAGAQGAAGSSGTSGANGSSGTSGAVGAAGSSGTSGANGSSGTSGANGAAGSSGTSGVSGTNGSSGTSGADGAAGSSGTSGVSGANGSSGTSGAAGPVGATGPLFPAVGFSGTGGVAVSPAIGATAASKSVLIPAGTFTLGDTVEIMGRFEKFSGTTTASATAAIYLNSSDTLTGAVLIGTAAGTLGVNTYSVWSIDRSVGILDETGVSAKSMATNTGILTAFDLTAVTSNTNTSPFYSGINWNNDVYVIYALTGINAANSARLVNYYITNKKGAKGDKGATGSVGATGSATVITNYGANRLLSSDGTSTGIDAESNLTFDGYVLGITGQGVSRAYNVGSTGGSVTVDWNNSNIQRVTLTSSISSFTKSNPVDGGVYTLQITQGGAGSYTVAWGSDVRWPGGTAPTLSTAAGAVDFVSFVYGPTSYYGNANLNFS